MKKSYDTQAAVDWACETVTEAAQLVEGICSLIGEEDMDGLRKFIKGYVAGLAFFASMLGEDEPADATAMSIHIITSYKKIGE